MIRYQGVSLPGFGVTVVLAILFAIGRSFIHALARIHWSHAALAGLGIWIVIDLVCVIGLSRKGGPPT